MIIHVIVTTTTRCHVLPSLINVNFTIVVMVCKLLEVWSYVLWSTNPSENILINSVANSHLVTGVLNCTLTTTVLVTMPPVVYLPSPTLCSPRQVLCLHLYPFSQS